MNRGGGVEWERLDAFTAQRPYLFAVAYRLLGTAEDAEDVLQDAWLRFASASFDALDNPRAYLVTIVTRLALDLLDSARTRREQYVGEWLPEPVTTADALPEDLAEQAESASFAFLLLLERLNPIERAVLVLHDVFDFSHEEIAQMTGRTAAASRQTLSRARPKLGSARLPSASERDEVRVQGLVEAARAGDVSRVISLLSPDVVLLSDGGGKVRTVARPLVGSEMVARFLVNTAHLPEMSRSEFVALNGQAAMLAYDGERLTNAVIFDITSSGVSGIYVVRNPEKLRRLQTSA